MSDRELNLKFAGEFIRQEGVPELKIFTNHVKFFMPNNNHVEIDLSIDPLEFIGRLMDAANLRNRHFLENFGKKYANHV